MKHLFLVQPNEDFFRIKLPLSNIVMELPFIIVYTENRENAMIEVSNLTNNQLIDSVNQCDDYSLDY